MSDIIGKVGGFFEKAAPAIGGVTAGAGLLGNIMNSIQRGNEVGKLQSAEKKFTSLTPEQLSGMVTKAEQPLGTDLLQNVGNLVQADLGTRGLSGAPGIFAAEESQALAPYKLQEQQMALQLIMKQLGLPIEYATAILQGMGGQSNVSPLLQLLMQGKPTTNQVPGIPEGTNPGDTTAAIIQQILAGQVPNTPGLVPDTGASAGTGGGLD
jgi:hypothetical protein